MCECESSHWKELCKNISRHSFQDSWEALFPDEGYKDKYMWETNRTMDTPLKYIWIFILETYISYFFCFAMIIICWNKYPQYSSLLNSNNIPLILSRPMLPLYRNQSINLFHKSIDWDLYDEKIVFKWVKCDTVDLQKFKLISTQHKVSYNIIVSRLVPLYSNWARYYVVWQQILNGKQPAISDCSIFQIAFFS